MWQDLKSNYSIPHGFQFRKHWLVHEWQQSFRIRSKIFINFPIKVLYKRDHNEKNVYIGENMVIYLGHKFAEILNETEPLSEMKRR